MITTRPGEGRVINLRFNKPCRLVLTGCFITFLSASVALSLTEHEKLREVYKGELKRAEEKQTEDLQRAVEDYSKGLEELEEQYQSAGELRPLLAIRKERQRFERDPDVSSIQVVAAPEKLKALQEKLLEAHKAAGATRARAVLDLGQKYKRRLRGLERELTQNGNIDGAVAVMTEADGIDTSPELRWAKRLLESGDSAPAAPAAAEPAAPVHTESLGQIVRGEIIEWNSMTRQLKCKYDFSSPEQIEDWPGATFDELRGRMSCDQALATSKPVFDSIQSIEYDGYFFTGEGHVTMRVGKTLTCVLGAGPELGKNRTYQENEHFPLSETTGGVKAYVRYSCALMLNPQSMRWTVNGELAAGTRLQTPVRFPAQVGFGHTESKTMFDNITITGVLNQRYVDSVLR